MGLENFIKRKKKIIIVIGILSIASVVFLIASVAFTERPEFCRSCHIMEPYYKSWKESSHKDVNCLDCHYEPNLKAHIKGKINGLVEVVLFMTGKYSEKYVAKVSDASCLRSGCHVKEDLKNKKIMFKDRVEFKHASHFKDFNELGEGVHLRCGVCHTWPTHDKHIAVDENTCLICHFKKVPEQEVIRQCITCHAEAKDIPDHKEILNEGVACQECHAAVKTTYAPVLKQMCYFCHADKNKIEKIKDRELLHERHISDNNASCMNCHELIQHGKEK